MCDVNWIITFITHLRLEGSSVCPSTFSAFRLLQSKTDCTQDDTVISHRTTININQSQQSIIINGASAFNKTLSECDIKELSNKLDDDAKSESSEIDDSNVNFSENREQWQKRALSQSNIKLPPSLKKENYLQRQNHTPDLVMDLPLTGSSSPKEIGKKSISVSANLEDDNISVKSLESPTGPESPDMTTAAERFAKQNQCTLKKNTKVHIDNSVDQNDLAPIPSPIPDRKLSETSTSSFKPQVKAKPAALLKKPVFCVPQEVLRKDQPDLTWVLCVNGCF